MIIFLEGVYLEVIKVVHEIPGIVRLLRKHRYLEHLGYVFEIPAGNHELLDVPTKNERRVSFLISIHIVLGLIFILSH